jgi:hypothetical protein
VANGKTHAEDSRIGAANGKTHAEDSRIGAAKVKTLHLFDWQDSS